MTQISFNLFDCQKGVVMRFLFGNFKIKVIDFRFEFGKSAFCRVGDNSLLNGFNHIVLRAQGFFSSLFQRFQSRIVRCFILMDVINLYGNVIDCGNATQHFYRCFNNGVFYPLFSYGLGCAHYRFTSACLTGIIIMRFAGM